MAADRDVPTLEPGDRAIAQGLARSDALHTAVQEMALHDRVADDAFVALAVRILRFQAAYVPPVGRLLAASDAWHEEGSLAVGDLAELPGLPVEAFRLTRIAAHPAELDERRFLTSGTTQGADARGAHPLRRMDTYRQVALAHGGRWIKPPAEELRVMSLVVDERRHPESSLATMIGFFQRAWAEPETSLLDDDAGLQDDELERRIALAHEAGASVLLCTTAFALAELLTRGRRAALPPNSRLMFTGGFKGRAPEVPESELVSRAASFFAVDESDVVGEYGMTELSSQLYQRTDIAGPRAYVPPPWMRVVAVDPETLRPVAPGEVGLAKLIDLANVDSAMIVQTEDRVRVTPEGIQLFGRASSAPARGCSLTAEEILGS